MFSENYEFCIVVSQNAEHRLEQDPPASPVCVDVVGPEVCLSEQA